jgi:hypothetical protein
MFYYVINRNVLLLLRYNALFYVQLLCAYYVVHNHKITYSAIFDGKHNGTSSEECVILLKALDKNDKLDVL